MTKMTLEQVRDWHRKHAAQIKLLERTFKEPDARAQWHTEMADAIDEHIKADEGAVQSARERVEMAMREPNAAKAAQVASELGAAHRAANLPAQPTKLEDVVLEVDMAMIDRARTRFAYIRGLNDECENTDMAWREALTAALQENAK